MIAAYDFEAVEANRQKLLETKKQLYFSKNKIGKLVVSHEFFKTKDFSWVTNKSFNFLFKKIVSFSINFTYCRITTQRFEELARWCAELFPSYMPESFFTIPKKNKNAGGALYTFYLKQREKEIAVGRLKGCKRKRPEEGNSLFYI